LRDPTVAGVFQVLSSSGLLASQLGVRGSYRRSRRAETTSIAEGLDAAEGRSR